MPNVIRIKRRAAAGSPGAPTSLATAELAYSEVDDILYIGFGDNGSGTATSIRSLAGPGSYVTLGTTQTISGTKTFSATPLISEAIANSENSTKVATTAFVKAQSYLTANQTITVSGDASGTGTTAITLTLASVGTAGTYTKVTTDAKGRVTSGTTLSASDIPTLTASKISDFDTQVRTSRLDQMAAPTADVSHNNTKITNLADPVNAQDAATKAYVDASRSGLDVKQSVLAASTAPVTVTYNATGGTSTRGQITAAPNTLDGVTLTANARILLKDQSTAAQNGIWVVSTVGTGANGVWDRATDFDADAEVTAGAFAFVEQGTTNADSGWVLTTDNPITIGGASGTALTFAQFSGAGTITAGSGLTKTGSTLNVGAGTGITVNADDVALTGQALAFHSLATNGIVARTASNTVAARTVTGTADRVTVTNGDGVSGNPTLDIASTYAGQATITTLGTIATGTWQGTAVGLQYGGTGANLSGDANGTIYKKGASGFTAATAGTDYLNDSSTIFGGTF